MGADDKHFVNIGVIPAKQAGKICMNITRQTVTPDHDFPPGKRHFFLPSCYKIFEFEEKYQAGSPECISNKGALKIVLRCGYFEHEHAYHHGQDIIEMLMEKKYFPWTRRKKFNEESKKYEYDEKDVKPILVIRTDNAKNYTPKNPKIQRIMYYLFKLCLYIFLTTFKIIIILFL